MVPEIQGSAHTDVDARDFALVALGGGLGSPLRETLKSDFRRKNPDVILLDTFAPVAISHISAALNTKPRGQQLATRFQITEHGGSHLMFLDVTLECVCVETYRAKSWFRGITLGPGHLSPGPFVLRIHEQELHAGLHIIVVTLGDTEFYLHRIER